MDLNTYYNLLPMQERPGFIERCGTSPGHMKNVIYGRVAGLNLCINIERESHGLVTCEEMRNDVDWNYLRGTKKRCES